MNVEHLMGVLNSFSIKNIFYDKMNLRLFYFCVTNTNRNQSLVLQRNLIRNGLPVSTEKATLS